MRSVHLMAFVIAASCAGGCASNALRAQRAPLLPQGGLRLAQATQSTQPAPPTVEELQERVRLLEARNEKLAEALENERRVNESCQQRIDSAEERAEKAVAEMNVLVEHAAMQNGAIANYEDQVEGLDALVATLRAELVACQGAFPPELLKPLMTPADDPVRARAGAIWVDAIAFEEAGLNSAAAKRLESALRQIKDDAGLKDVPLRIVSQTRAPAGDSPGAIKALKRALEISKLVERAGIDLKRILVSVEFDPSADAGEGVELRPAKAPPH